MLTIAAEDNLTIMALRSVSTKIKEISLPAVINLTVKRPVSSIIDWEPKETETHTGQKWGNDDYRLCRFVDKPKQVNHNWAVKLVAEVPPIPVKGSVTFCDGGQGATGHPKVYINLDKPGYHSCLYCGLRFYKEHGNH